MTAISAECLSALIGLIYDCAIDPDAWEDSLETIRRALGFHNAGLEVYALPSAANVLRVVTGPAPEYIAAMPEFGSEIIETWGGMERVARFPLEEPVVASHVVARETMRATRYYREWCEPQGVFDAVAIPFVRDATTLGSVAMGRHVSAGEITEADLVPLRLIAPHFRRAVSINRLLRLQSIHAASFSATLDGLDTGIVFVDERMRVAHANTAASDLLKAGDLMGLHQGSLRLMDQAAGAEIATAVALAAGSAAQLGRRGIGIPARRREGEPAVIHVLPLGGGASRGAMVGQTGAGQAVTGQAVAALFVASGRAAPAVPTAALARLYDLTPTEARIMELIADGRTPAEAGAQLGVALSTVKSHLKQVFGKTGCQRQADLVGFANAFRRPA